MKLIPMPEIHTSYLCPFLIRTCPSCCHHCQHCSFRFASSDCVNCCTPLSICQNYVCGQGISGYCSWLRLDLDHWSLSGDNPNNHAWPHSLSKVIYALHSEATASPCYCSKMFSVSLVSLQPGVALAHSGAVAHPVYYSVYSKNASLGFFGQPSAHCPATSSISLVC